MEPKSILLIVITIILLYVIVMYIMKDSNTLAGLNSGKTMQKIESSTLDISSSSTSNFTYSIWFYIDDWNYRYGEEKILFGRMINDNSKNNPCPLVSFGSVQNDVSISLTVYPGQDQAPQDQAPAPGSNNIHTCNIANVPIQKWVNLFISVYGRTLDVYIDGKLVRTSIMPGVARIDGTAPIYITPMTAFSGWTSKFQYWSSASDPQMAWNVYRKGYGGSLLGSLFGKYTLKVALMHGDAETSSLTI